MRRSVILIGLIALFLCGCGKKTNDFHGFRWGDSPQKIIKSEKRTLVVDSCSGGLRELNYKSSINGHSCKLTYMFDQYNRLREIEYLIIAHDSIEYESIKKETMNDLRKNGKPSPSLNKWDSTHGYVWRTDRNRILVSYYDEFVDDKIATHCLRLTYLPNFDTDQWLQWWLH